MMCAIIKRLFSCVLCCTLAAFCFACAGAQREKVKVLEERVDDLEGQITHYEERIDDLSNQIFVLTDRIDSTRVEMGRPLIPPDLRVVRLMPEDTLPPKEIANATQSQGSEKPLNIRMRGEQMPKLGDLVSSPKVRKSAANAEIKPAAERVFRRALEFFRQGKTESAYLGFSDFLSTYPNHEYADNALYWMGDCRYEEEKFPDALSEFLKVVRFYPRSNKMPDVLFKIGLSYQRLDEPQKAQSAFADLVTGYPGSAFADLAKARMKDFKRVDESQN